jgi:adenosine deaminase
MSMVRVSAVWFSTLKKFSDRAVLAAAFVAGMVLSSQTALSAEKPQGPQLASAAETRTARALEQARKQGPPALRAFLYAMPKGSDLHVHLSGAVYAESFIRAAGVDGLCVNPATLSFVSGATAPACASGTVPAADAPKDQHLYDALIDAFSMRSFVGSNGNSGHDHFFDTFDKFGGTSKVHVGEWIDEVATRAAAQNEQYLELMHTPDFKDAASMAMEIGYQSNFAEYRQLLLDHGLRNSIADIRAQMDEAEAKRQTLEHCGQPSALPACKVEVRYIYQILRGLPKEIVFAQTVLAFEVASADPRFVGLNFVMPEDGYVSMADYRLHMQMLDVLHGLYPKVHISLHAGELAYGMVPPDGLAFHIRSAVEQGHAERIGHGVDVMYEDRPYELLKEMAARHVMVEINLSSNDVILGVKGNDHPLPFYRKYGVPVSLSTDDEGVSRIDLTNEYVRAVDTYGFSYAELKQMVRTGLEHSFLPGVSLWVRDSASKVPGERFDRPVAACSAQLGRDQATGACATFLKSSDKAREQWELERRFHAFEASF